MASSRKSSRNKVAPVELAARVAAQLNNIVKPGDCLVVALSGGVDSVTLLDCLHRVRRKLRVRLSALHINHQLSRNADQWSAFCRRLCRERGIPFDSMKVKVRRGDSLEARARDARYAVFARQNCDYIMLAHHRDDQVETLLLQLLRGAGVKGLAAMPLLRREGRGERREGKIRALPAGSPHSSHLTPHILRPLLDVTRADILDYARERGLEWIEDESNQDVQFQRNFLRHEVLPVIARRFPAYRTTVARSARHLAEAARLLDGIAADDAAGWMKDGALEVAVLRRLARARARNLLRHFLASHGISMPGTARLEEALRQALGAKQDAKVLVELHGATLRRFRGRLFVVRTTPVPPRYSRRWHGEEQIALPELGGVLRLRPVIGTGIGVSRLRGGALTIQSRRGGERLQPDCRRPRRSLKNLLQEGRMPPWQRERIPLIFCGGKLVWAATVGVDCVFQAGAGETAIEPAWSLRD